MSEIAEITEVEALEGHRIRARFRDGAVKEIDLADVLAAGGVLRPIYENRDLFERVSVNAESRTIEWPGGIDLDPDVLYGPYEPASGRVVRRRVIRQPASNW